MHRKLLTAALGLALLPLGGCTFYDTATEWNGRVGVNGEPVYYKVVTNIGFNLAIFIPFVGGTTISELVDDLTADIKQDGGSVVRIVQGDKENYWYGWSPLTWIITPVVATLSAEYQPSKEQIEKVEKEKTDG